MLATTFGLLSFYYSNAPYNAIPPVTECEQSLSYDVVVYRYFVLPDTSDAKLLTTLEKLKLKPKTESKRIEQCIDVNGELSTEIFLFNPEEVLAEWMPKLKRTVISRDSVKMYDQEENLIHERRRSNVLSALHDSIEVKASTNGLGIPLSFNELVTNETQKLQQDGFNVATLQDGTILASDENMEIRYFPSTYFIERQEFESESLKLVEKRQYAVDSLSNLVPLFYRTEIYRTFPASEVCFKEIRVQVFRNYVRAGDSGHLLRVPSENSHGTPAAVFSEHSIEKTQSNSGNLSLMPNPSKGELQVNLPVGSAEDYVSLRIVDAYGRTVAEYSDLLSGVPVTVDINDLNPGIYFFQAETGGVFYTERFVKQ